MAKELGLNPKSLIKNIPNKNQSWKKPVYLWIREMYWKRNYDNKKIYSYELALAPRKYKAGIYDGIYDLYKKIKDFL